MTGTFVNTSFPPRRVDLADGRVLAPGERAENVKPDEHNKQLEDAGDITREPKKEKS